MKLKKLMGMALASSLAISSLSACGDKETGNTTTPTPEPTATTAPANTPTPEPTDDPEASGVLTATPAPT